MAVRASIESIIERQARFWEVRDRLGRQGGEEARRALVHLEEGPYVSVSRQLGSGGRGLARGLAAEFGWQLYDKELVGEIARHTHARETVLARLDEKAVDVLNDYLRQMFVEDDPGRTAYAQEMARVVWGLGRQGSVVILGRGANWILRPAFGLRLRCVADEALRFRRVAEDREITIAEAETRVRDNDRRQAAFIRQSFGRDIDDPLGYDLVLNLGTLDLATALDTAAAALRQKLRHPGRSA